MNPGTDKQDIWGSGDDAFWKGLKTEAVLHPRQHARQAGAHGSHRTGAGRVMSWVQEGKAQGREAADVNSCSAVGPARRKRLIVSGVLPRPPLPQPGPGAGCPQFCASHVGTAMSAQEQGTPGGMSLYYIGKHLPRVAQRGSTGQEWARHLQH